MFEDVHEDKSSLMESIIMQEVMGTGYKPVLTAKRRVLDISGKILRKEYDIRVDLYENDTKSKGRSKVAELETHTFTSLGKMNFSEIWDECCDEVLSRDEKGKRAAILHNQAAQMDFDDTIYIDCLGLVQNAFVRYVYSRGHVICESSKIVKYVFSDEIPDFGIKQSIDFEMQIECFQNIMKSRPRIWDIMFCVRLLSVLKPLMKNTENQQGFIVMVYGEFGSGKTEFSKAMFVANEMQLMNFTRDNAIPLKKRMKALEGHVLLLDDYHPAENGHWIKKQKTNLDIVSRFADSGTGALVVATGEYMEGAASLQDRVIPIYVDKRPDVVDQIRNLKTMKKTLEELIWEFAFRVYSQKEQILKKIEFFCRDWNKGNYDFRIERNIRYLYLAMCIFHEVFPEIECNAFDEQLSNSIRILENKHLDHMEKVRRIESGVDWTNEVFLMLNEPEKSRTYEWSEKSIAAMELVIDNGKVYITRSELERRMKKYLSMWVDVNKIAENLEMSGVLETDNSKSRTKKVHGKYYYVINRAALELHHRQIVGR